MCLFLLTLVRWGVAKECGGLLARDRPGRRRRRQAGKSGEEEGEGDDDDDVDVDQDDEEEKELEGRESELVGESLQVFKTQKKL